MVQGNFKNFINHFCKRSKALFIEKHEVYYKKNKYLSFVFIILDALLVSPIRSNIMLIKEKGVNTAEIDKLINENDNKTVDFLLFGRGGFKRNNSKKSESTHIEFSIEGDSFFAKGITNSKFSNDRIIVDNENFILLMEGVFFNLQDILDEYSLTNIYDLAVKILNENSEKDIIKKLRGEFHVILYNKQLNTAKFFVDHYSMKKMYYYFDGDRFLISTNFDELAQVLIENNIKVTLSESAAYMMLTLGYMVEDNTIINEIKKLEGGFIAKIENNEIQIDRYYQLENRIKTTDSYNNIIDKMDSLFRNAVKRQFSKNEEYGYKQIGTLSGGLDSRMVFVVAHNMGYENIKAITFGQSDTWDEKIANDISNDMGFNWEFFALDNANHIFNIEHGIKISGQTIYSESAKGANYFKYNTNNEYGLIHTGQVGDAIVGYFGELNNNESINIADGAASTFLIKKIDNDILKKVYINHEEYLFMQRVFNSTLYGNADYEQGRFSYSPFLDVDFFDYCMTIPNEYRLNHKIYKDWIIRKYPNAANYIWEKTKDYITNDVTNSLEVKYRPKFYSMNPYETWYKNNAKMRVFIKTIFKLNIQNNVFNNNLRSDIISLFNKGSVREKLQVITLLILVKKYWR